MNAEVHFELTPSISFSNGSADDGRRISHEYACHISDTSFEYRSSSREVVFSGNAISYAHIRIVGRALSCNRGISGVFRAGAQVSAFRSERIELGYDCGVNGFVSFVICSGMRASS